VKLWETITTELKQAWMPVQKNLEIVQYSTVCKKIKKTVKFM